MESQLAGAARFQVYFGGTFDPPHIGHQQILKVLERDAWVERVHLVPTFQNPLKESSSLWSAEKRLELCEHWLKHEFRSEKIYLEKNEITEGLKSNRASYTYDSLKALKEKQGGRWALALGSDILPSFSKWHRAKELLSEIEALWIFTRQSQVEALAAESTSDSPVDLAVNMAAGQPGLFDQTSFRVFPEKIAQISSTEIRALLQKPNASQNLSNLIPSSLKDLILTH